MTTEEFKNEWTKNGDTLSPLSMSRLKKLKLLSPTIEFLTISGLPSDAAPFLSFAQDIDDVFFGINKLTEQYEGLGTEYEKYIVIGSCNNGDSIAINTDKNDQIEWLDHEDLFSSRFFNTSIMTLAKCLIAYRDFIHNIQKENGEDAYMSSDFTDEQFDKFKQEMTIADNRAISEDGFWREQLNLELELRQYEKDKK